jgi:uncharacterized repeat protein (TIGR02543 family)
LGYTFTGWFSNEAETTPYIIPTTMLAENIIVYAGWSINQYSIAFETDGGTLVESITQDYNTSVNQPDDPTKTGHTFGGWFSDSAFTVPYSFDTMPAENVVLYADWQVNTYEVTMILDDNNTYTMSGFYGQAVVDILDNRELTKTGHTFSGWYSDANFETMLTDSLRITENAINLFARWEKNTYKLTYVVDGVVYEEGELIFEGVPSLPEPPTKTGYVFQGWRYDEAIFDATFVMPASDIVVEASFTGVTVNIIFVTESILMTKNVTSGEIIGILPALTTIATYRFIGWSLIFNDGASLIDENFIVPVSETLRLYPIWEVSAEPSTLGGKTRPHNIESTTLPWVSVITFGALTSFILAGIFMTLKRSYGHI